MKYKWLNQKNNNKVIVFYNGWGMDESVVNHLECEDYDVVMFYDYNNLETDFGFKKNYNSRHLIAWSMGVMTATLSNIDFTSATAINGTLKPINPEFGIHPRIYDLTIRGFDEKGRERFIKNMFDKETPLEINRTLENQKTELDALKKYSANESFRYTKILISDNDKIIPTKSQCAFWKTEPNLQGGHCPFNLFSKWSELL